MEMELKYTFEKSAVITRVIAALQTSELSIDDICRVAFTSRTQASRAIRHLRPQVHIADWRRSKSGPPVPLYTWGVGSDAEKLTGLSNGQKCERYRAKQKKVYGENYSVVREAQKKHVPGRRVVIGGKTIYCT